MLNPPQGVVDAWNGGGDPLLGAPGITRDFDTGLPKLILSSHILGSLGFRNLG